jgi:hypothetical protein
MGSSAADEILSSLFPLPAIDGEENVLVRYLITDRRNHGNHKENAKERKEKNRSVITYKEKGRIFQDNEGSRSLPAVKGKNGSKKVPQG